MTKNRHVGFEKKVLFIEVLVGEIRLYLIFENFTFGVAM